MPRFSLGTHRLQEQNKTKRQSFNRIREWWHRFRDKLTAPAPDFGDLSPDRPPLPYIGSIADAVSQTDNGRLSRTISNTSPSSERGTSSNMSTSNLLTFGDRTSRQGNLYTIYEESETVKSESSMAPPRSTFEEENKSRPLPRESHASEGEEPDTATSSDGPYHPRLFWPYQKVEPTFDRALVGDEEACRQRFMQMIQSVYASHNECKDPVPRDIEVVFDGQDNVQFIRFAIHGRTEQHKFTGISQFIPPEVAMAEGPRSCELADVWILGINLYRMLIGKFPFAGSNDRKIFKKMLHAEFRIPQGYSEDVKDLLLRMLAPETTRASLDLILYHEWLKPCKSSPPAPLPTLPFPLPSTGPSAPDKPVSANVGPGSLPPSPSPPPSSPPLISSQPASARGKSKHRRFPRALEHAVVFLVKGPYPPPRRPYRDLSQPVQL